MPGIRQEQFEGFQGQGMDKDHINGLEPQHKQMPEPERPDGEHQEQQMGQIAEQVQELEHAAFQLQRSPAEKSRQEQEFQEKDPQMSQEQHLPPVGTSHGPEGIVPEISRRQQGKTEQEYSGKSITHGRNQTKEDNMFQITPSGSAVECVQYDNNFRVCFSNPNQGLASAQYIGENGLAEKIAVIYDSSDVYSSGIYEKFAKEAENQPFEIVAAEAFTADNKTDFSVQLQKAKDAGADMVFLPIYYQESALILTQAAAMGYAPKWFSCDGMDGILGGVDNFDVSLTEGVMLLTPFAADATDDLTQSFVTKYKEKYGETPNQFAADSYDAIYVIKAAIEKSGVTPDMSVSDICDGMKAAMTEITVDGLTGSGMTWTADGEANKAPKAVVIENGAYKAM